MSHGDLILRTFKKIFIQSVLQYGETKKKFSPIFDSTDP